MNKKWLVIALAVTVALAAIALAGCGGGSTDSEDPEDPEASKLEQEADKWNDPAEIESLLAKGEDMPGCTYDSVMTVPGIDPLYQKIWVMPGKVRSEREHPLGNAILVSIINTVDGVMYSYDSASNIATLMAIVGDLGEDFKTPQDYADDLDIPGMMYVRREVFDDKDCIVYEMHAGSLTSKMWIWEEHGIPLKIIGGAGNDEIVVEFLSFVYGPVPDEMFELPPGATIMNLGDLGVTGGL